VLGEGPQLIWAIGGRLRWDTSEMFRICIVCAAPGAWLTWQGWDLQAFSNRDLCFWVGRPQQSLEFPHDWMSLWRTCVLGGWWGCCVGSFQALTCAYSGLAEEFRAGPVLSTAGKGCGYQA